MNQPLIASKQEISAVTLPRLRMPDQCGLWKQCTDLIIQGKIIRKKALPQARKGFTDAVTVSPAKWQKITKSSYFLERTTYDLLANKIYANINTKSIIASFQIFCNRNFNLPYARSGRKLLHFQCHLINRRCLWKAENIICDLAVKKIGSK